MIPSTKIGIMQGRLSPQTGKTIQSFPVDTWRDEFPRAQEAGLCCIEWIYETGTDGANPLRTDEGIKRIRELEMEWSVVVQSVCADYYMNSHLVSPSGATTDPTKKHLEWLIGRASLLDCQYIVLPFIDSSSMRNPEQIRGLIELLGSIIPPIEKNNVEIHLETDLQPAVLVDIMRELDHELIRLNYDIGNSASLGHDPREELTILRGWIGSVHVKDRLPGGGTVPLGSGAADFPYCFSAFKSMNFARPYILQAARDMEISEIDLAVRNRKFIESFYCGAPSYPLKGKGKKKR
ncbi:sugar phosphate isomerase/epimerase family protein [Methanoregula sp.]|uniref:sugar phosphate isomerase/epimerase family protein n=1 Tax=Methanoregula sp. TaxID=2052170 RepID=UPI00356AE9A2